MSKISKSFKKGVRESITDENYAPKHYRKLAKRAATPEMKKTLLWIAKQEENHHKKLVAMNEKIKGGKK